MPKTKITKKIQTKKRKSILHSHDHKLSKIRIFLLIVLLLVPITTAFLLLTNFKPREGFANNSKNNPGLEIQPTRKPDGAMVDKFKPTETAFINDFTIKITDFKVVNTESDKFNDFCITGLEIFNFSNQTLVSADQFQLSQGGQNLELWDQVMPSNPLKLNYSADLEKNKATNIEIYFKCNNLNQDTLNFTFTPFRDDNIKSQKDNFPVFDSKKNQYYASLNFEISLNDSFLITAKKDLPIEIKPIKFELTTLNKVSLCILRLELSNTGYSPWLFDESDLDLKNSNDKRLNRLVVDPNAGEVFRKIPLEAGQTEMADYAFNCNIKGDYTLNYTPKYITADFVENKTLAVKLSL